MAIKIPGRLFCTYRQDFPKNILQKGKGTKIAETILKNKNKVGEISLPNFKIYYIAIIIKTVVTG